MGNHRETQMPSIKQKDQGYKPKSWVINKEVRFWGFVIVVTAAPATFEVKDQRPNNEIQYKTRWNQSQYQYNKCSRDFASWACREHANVRCGSVFSSFFPFCEIFFALPNENQRTQNRSTFWRRGRPIAQKQVKAKGGKKVERRARMKTIQAEEETVSK